MAVALCGRTVGVFRAHLAFICLCPLFLGESPIGQTYRTSFYFPSVSRASSHLFKRLLYLGLFFKASCFKVYKVYGSQGLIESRSNL